MTKHRLPSACAVARRKVTTQIQTDACPDGNKRRRDPLDAHSPERPEPQSASMLSGSRQDRGFSSQDGSWTKSELQDPDLCLKNLRASLVVSSKRTRGDGCLWIFKILVKSREWCAEHVVGADAPDKPLLTLEERLCPLWCASRCTAPARSSTTSFCTPQAKSNASRKLIPCHRRTPATSRVICRASTSDMA